ncbi:hypothetical protein ACWGIU_23385 [Streptomyces sp. NPDC054840]
MEDISSLNALLTEENLEWCNSRTPEKRNSLAGEFMAEQNVRVQNVGTFSALPGSARAPLGRPDAAPHILRDLVAQTVTESAGVAA